MKEAAKYRFRVARDSSTPVDTLVKLAVDEDWNVREQVASNPHTPVETLVQLATDKNLNVRKGVAWNLNTPVATLAQLAIDTYWHVREHVARNPNTPATLLNKLGTDEDWNVRSAVTWNPHTPIESVIRLLNYDTLPKRSMVVEVQTPTKVSAVVLEVAVNRPALPLALALSYHIWMKRCGSTYEEARCTAITGEQAMIFYKDGEAFWK